MKLYVALFSLIALISIVPAFSQDVDCTEEFFRIVRDDTQCQNFAVCMVGGRVNFFCDDGDIFDTSEIACRPAIPGTCEFTDDAQPYMFKPLSEFL